MGRCPVLVIDNLETPFILYLNAYLFVINYQLRTTQLIKKIYVCVQVQCSSAENTFEKVETQIATSTCMHIYFLHSSFVRPVLFFFLQF